MDGLSIGLQRLHAARTKEQLVDALWDLRDSAYDEPQVWSTFTAERLFQTMAQELDQSAAQDDDHVSVHELAQVLTKAFDPRAR